MSVDLGLRRECAPVTPKSVEAGQCKLNAHCQNDQSHEPSRRVFQKPATLLFATQACDEQHHQPGHDCGNGDGDQRGDWQFQTMVSCRKRNDSGNRTGARGKQDQRRERLRCMGIGAVKILS